MLFTLVGALGIEPRTSVLSGQRSTTELCARARSLAGAPSRDHSDLLNVDVTLYFTLPPLCAHEGSDLGPSQCQCDALPLSYARKGGRAS